MDKATFENLRFLPDPLIQEDGNYLPFEEAFSRVTTKQDCPLLKGKAKAKLLSFSPSVQHINNTGTVIQCEECSLWRLVFSKRKLSVAARNTLQSILEDVSYTCGASLEDLTLPESLASVVICEHRCGDKIEALYYSAGFEDICIYCAVTTDLVQVSESSYPICTVYHQTKEPVSKRRKSNA